MLKGIPQIGASLTNYRKEVRGERGALQQLELAEAPLGDSGNCRVVEEAAIDGEAAERAIAVKNPVHDSIRGREHLQERPHPSV
jgi:hypothetical protein